MRDTEVNLPPWTVSGTTAVSWAKAGKSVYCRGDLEGRDGRGIVIATNPTQVVHSDLYTTGIEADQEYRVHVFKHKPIFDLVKWHDNPSKKNQLIRTGGNGWQYSRDVVVPEAAKEQAVLTSRALQLDFCAVDLLYNTKTEKATVLEANSAPELGPWTSAAYAKELVALTK